LIRRACRKRRDQYDPLRRSTRTTPVELGDMEFLRRNTDRTSRHREAQLALAITLILAAKLIDWRNRYSPIR